MKNVQAVVLFWCILTVIAVPFIVSFESRLKPPLTQWTLDITLALIELFFLADVYMNFRIAYYSLATGLFVTQRRQIARRYAKGMLLLDLLACCPVTIVWRFCMSGKNIHSEVLGPFAILQCVPTTVTTPTKPPLSALQLLSSQRKVIQFSP